MLKIKNLVVITMMAFAFTACFESKTEKAIDAVEETAKDAAGAVEGVVEDASESVEDAVEDMHDH